MTNNKIKKDMREECECGGYKYKYSKNGNDKNSLFKLIICYKCGKFTGESTSDEVLELLTDDVELLLHMIHNDHLIPDKSYLELTPIEQLHELLKQSIKSKVKKTRKNVGRK